MPDEGFFIEAGAYDGFNESNTYFLERFRGWKGLLIEPVPELYRLARKERSESHVVNCALVAPEQGGQPIRIRFAGRMSIVSGARGDESEDDAYLDAGFLFDDEYEVDVPGRTLSELLAESGSPEVDFLSLDLEGYEDQALMGLDLDRHAPRLVLVEVQTQSHLDAVKRVLGSRYRLLEQITSRDVLFEKFIS